MIEILRTRQYAQWFKRLRDAEGRERILDRLENVQLGLFGDVKPVGRGVSEIRINTGPGYRIYFMRQGKKVIILLAGGDKDSQERDIRLALQLAREIKEEQ